MFEKNNPRIAFNILYTEEKEIRPAYILKLILVVKKFERNKKKANII